MAFQDGLSAFLTTWFGVHTAYSFNQTNANTGTDTSHDANSSSYAQADTENYPNYGLAAYCSPDASGDMDIYIITDVCMLLYIPEDLATDEYALFHNGGGTHGQMGQIRSQNNGEIITLGITHNANGTNQDYTTVVITERGWVCIGFQFEDNSGNIAIWVNGVNKAEVTRTYSLAYGSGNPRIGDGAADAIPGWGALEEIDGTGLLIANFVCDNPNNDNSDPAGCGDDFYADYYDEHYVAGHVDLIVNEATHDHLADNIVLEVPTEWLTGWGFRKEITIQDANVDGNLTDFPVFVFIDADADFHEARADGYDIRFTSDDGQTLLPYHRMSWSGGNGSAATAYFRVKVPSILSSGGAIIFCYYGKSDASDGEDKANTYDSDYLLFANLNEAASTYDDAAGSNDGTGDADPTRIAGANWYGQSFDGAESIDFGAVAETSEIFLSFWMRCDDRTQNGIIVCQDSNSSADADFIIVMAGVYSVFVISSPNYRQQVTFTTFTDDVWYHIGVYGNLANGSNSWTLYVNGSVVGLGASSINIGGSDGHLTLGVDGGSESYWFSGDLEDFKVSGADRGIDWNNFEYHNEYEGDNELTWAAEEEEAGATELVISEASHAHLADALVLIQAHTLSSNEATHAHTVDSPVLAQSHILVVAEATHAHSVDAPVLIEHKTLDVSEADHTQTVDEPVITQAHTLAVADGTHAHDADSPILTQAHTLVINESDHAHSADVPVLTQVHTLAVSDASHAHAADEPVLDVSLTLVVQEASHAHAVDSPVLTQVHTLAVNEATHNHLADNIDLEAGIVLEVSDGVHAFTVDPIILIQAYTLAINEAIHDHVVDPIILSQVHNLTVTDGLHGHLADNIILELPGTLSVADGQHNHIVDPIILSQAHQLAVSDGGHNHLADNIDFEKFIYIFLDSFLTRNLNDSANLTEEMNQLSYLTKQINLISELEKDINLISELEKDINLISELEKDINLISELEKDINLISELY